MLFHLLGAVMIGVTAASLVMIAFRLSGRRSPRWLLPLSAGAAMLGFQVWSEYTWFSRTAAELPPHVAVAGTFTGSHALQPWTLVRPRIDRFSAVDLNSVRWNDEAPELRIAEVYLVGRNLPTATTVQVYDCDRPRRAPMPASPVFDETGRPTNLQWTELSTDDQARRLVCDTV
jgi:hypothetical protein